jgi:ribosomal protein S18 acetylase RimI-like enzyme
VSSPEPRNRPELHVVKIQRVRRDDWERIRDLRLRALEADPGAFGSTHAQEANADEDSWRSWATAWSDASEQALFAALVGERWVGMSLGVRWNEDPEVVHLYAMWVEPSSRRQGVGLALVRAVIGWAADLGVGRVVLSVTEDNGGALALYERCGFEDTGERKSLREGSDVTTVLMSHPV